MYVGRPVPRTDAREKATGELKYLTDLTFPGMLHGRVKRADHPHALIKGIDTTAARALPGVVAVLTHEDVPGQNGFGIVIPDQPVLCGDKVRYLGDALALVAAETPEAAARTLELIRVEYAPLPVVDDPRRAMGLFRDSDVAFPEGLLVHQSGNVLQHNLVVNGDVDRGLAEVDLIIENRFVTSRQMHSFIETEGGVATIDEDEEITIYAGSQHSYRDQLQIARTLGIPPKKIRVVSNPTGGGFGGKDEIVVQIHLALLTYHTRRPVKIWLSREESVRVGVKRTPEFLAYRTGVRRDGTLVANRVDIVADTGAYATLGGPVTSLSVGHCCGPYRVPNVRIENHCVYTNNGVSGAMRGFGVNQVTFAMETQMDIIARELGIDPVELRKRNALRRGDDNPLGFRMSASVGAMKVLEAAEKTDLWLHREERKAGARYPWLKRGVGFAMALQGNGLGAGRPDYGAATIRLEEDGTFTVGVSCPEIGQGNSTAYAQIAADALGCPLGAVRVITGDTGRTADSGSTSASRGVYTGGNAIILAAREIRQRLAEPGLSPEARSSFVWPAAEREIEGAPGLPEIIYSYAAAIALVEVDTLTGRVQVLEAVTVPEAGKVINPLGIEGQAGGGAAMGLGYALTEEVLMSEGRYRNWNFSTYILPTALDVPAHETVVVEELEETGPFGAKGAGEVVCVPITPAITNAIYDAVGVRITELPATAERVHALLKAAGDAALSKQTGGPVASIQ